MEVKVFNTFDSKELQETWECLYEKSECTPQSSFHWNYCWWEAYKSDNKNLEIITVVDNFTIIAILPMFIEAKYSLKKLKFIGDGLTDYADIIFDCNYEMNITFDIIDAYLKINKKWDIILWNQINDRSSLYFLLANKYRKRKFIISCPTIIFTSNNWDDYISLLGKSQRKNIKKRLKKFQNDFSEFEICKYSKNNISENTVNEVIKIHSSRNEIRNQKSKFSVESGNLFYRKACVSMLNSDNAYLYVLKVNNTVFSYAFILKGKNISYNWNSSFNPTYYDYSPGTVMESFVIQDLLKSGTSNYDFMRGGYDYKKRWLPKNSGVVSNNYLFVTGKRTLKSLLCSYYYFKGRDVLKLIYNRFK